jgi:hypothetical protein
MPLEPHRTGLDARLAIERWGALRRAHLDALAPPRKLRKWHLAERRPACRRLTRATGTPDVLDRRARLKTPVHLGNHLNHPPAAPRTAWLPSRLREGMLHRSNPLTCRYPRGSHESGLAGTSPNAV